MSDIASPDVAGALTRRERQVALLASNGLPNKLIARQLGLTEGTVKQHLNTIFRKIGVRNRTALMRVLSRPAGSHPHD
jgi:DNA-binding NarL/FixJ family response regulator